MCGKENKSAAKAGIGYTIGNVLIKGLSFLTLPIFTRLMSTADYGLYTTFVSYENIITLVSGLGLYASLKTAKIEYKDKVDSYVSTVSLLTIAFTCLLMLIAFPFKEQIGAFFGFNGYITLLMVAQAWASAVITMYNCRVSLDFAYKRYIALSLIISVCNICLSLGLILTVNKNDPFIGRVLGTSLPLIIIAIILVIGFFHKASPERNRDFIKFGLDYSLPLIPHGVSQLILAQFGKIIIQKKIGNEAAGIYGFAYTIALIPQILASSLDTAWGPWFFETYEKGQINVIKKRATQYVALFSVATVGLFCVSPEIIKIMADKSYWSSIQIVCPAVLRVFFTFLYGIPAQIEYYYKKTKYTAVGTMLAAVLNIVFCMILVPKYGYEMAVYVTVATYILYFTAHMIIAGWITKWKLPFNVKEIVCYTLIVCAMCAVMQAFLDKWLFRYLFTIAFCILVVFINRKGIIDFLETQFQKKTN